MAQIIHNNGVHLLTGAMRHWAYNSLDCCITREVADELLPRLTPTTRRTYEFEMATQSPAMAMMLRGVRVDLPARSRALKELEKDESACHAQVQELLPEGVWDRRMKVAGKCQERSKLRPDYKQGGVANHKWGPKDQPETEQACEACGQRRYVPAPLNPLSDDQASELFYERLRLPKQYGKTGGVTVNEEALDKLRRRFPVYKPLIDEILNARGIRKSAGFVGSTLSSDGRMRYSLNVGGPETGRMSSSANHYREGTNVQNIPEKLRYIFIADPGMELVYADLEQAESHCVAYLAEDEEYIAAHKAGDVHTYVCRLIWPELPWTGDLKKDKKIAEELHPDWDRDHSYRYNSKRIQHGSNYGLTPPGLARLAHIPMRAAQEAQGRYFSAFPGIPAWHQSVFRRLQETHTITTPLGRQRLFFGRHWDLHVKRQALAQEPQSMVADILNTAIWRVWREMDTFLTPGRSPRISDPNEAWLLAQVHDAILGEVRKGDDAAVEKIIDLMRIPVEVNGRVMVIPADVKRGANWGKHSDKNPGGMR